MPHDRHGCYGRSLATRVQHRVLVRCSLCVLGGGLLWAFVTSAGCGSDEDRAKRRGESARIVVVARAKDEPTWAVIKAVAKQLEEEHRFVDVEVVAPETDSPREQRELLERLATHEVGAVCVAPSDAAAVRSAIDELARNGVPVVTVGLDVVGANQAVYCGPSEMEIGRAAARACDAAVAGRSKTVILLHAGRDDPVYGKRYQGFIQELRFYPDVRLLREVDCAQSRSKAVSLVRLESRKYPRVGCWVFLDDWPLRASPSDEPLLPPGCGVVLCNGLPRYLDRLRDGRIAALITYDYPRSVREALLATVQLAKDRPAVITPRHVAPVEIVTAKELPSYEARWMVEDGE
ncbi:MAG: substrate-binding domain-containing protein [Phycisphaerae bacterium]|nr:substrate-binding domain-containing protein [Phycisphaerae bacterium]